MKQDGEDEEDQRKDEVKLQGPMAMIITEKEVRVFLFPFQYNGSVLVTALALAPIKLFCDTTVLDPSSLFLLAFITKNRPLSDVVLQGIEFSDEKMRRSLRRSCIFSVTFNDSNECSPKCSPIFKDEAASGLGRYVVARVDTPVPPSLKASVGRKTLDSFFIRVKVPAMN